MIRKMCQANPLWGAPRLHGELLKLGEQLSGKQWLANFQAEIEKNGGQLKPEDPWFLNLADNIDQIGERRFRKRFGDWADADAIAAHYGYGNDIFCTDDRAKGAGGRSILSANRRAALTRKYGIHFRSLLEVCQEISDSRGVGGEFIIKRR